MTMTTPPPELSFIKDYTDQTKFSCFITAFALLLIVAIFIAPVSISPLARNAAKLVILLLISMSAVILYSGVSPMLNIKNFFDNESYDPLKNGFYLTMIYIGFLIILGVFILGRK